MITSFELLHTREEPEARGRLLKRSSEGTQSGRGRKRDQYQLNRLMVLSNTHGPLNDYQ